MQPRKVLFIEPLESLWLLNGSFGISRQLVPVLTPELSSRSPVLEETLQGSKPILTDLGSASNEIGPFPTISMAERMHPISGYHPAKADFVVFEEKRQIPSLPSVSKVPQFFRVSEISGSDDPKADSTIVLTRPQVNQFWENSHFPPRADVRFQGKVGFAVLDLPSKAALGENADTSMAPPGFFKFMLARRSDVLQKRESLPGMDSIQGVDLIPNESLSLAIGRVMPLNPLPSFRARPFVALLANLAMSAAPVPISFANAIPLADPIQVAGDSVIEHQTVISSAGTTIATSPAFVRSARGGQRVVDAPRVSLERRENPTESDLRDEGPTILPLQLGMTALPEPIFAPQAAGLLTNGLTVSVRGLERTVHALIEPMVDGEGRPTDLLQFVGIVSWLFAAGLACEGMRRRWAIHTTRESLYTEVVPHLTTESQL